MDFSARHHLVFPMYLMAKASNHTPMQHLPQVRQIVPASEFALDVDVPEDLSAVYQQQPGSQTASYLNRSGIARRLYATHQSHSG